MQYEPQHAIAAILARGVRRLIEQGRLSTTCLVSERERVSLSLGSDAQGQGEKVHG